jgi:hypothetical protein
VEKQKERKYCKSRGFETFQSRITHARATFPEIPEITPKTAIKIQKIQKNAIHIWLLTS